MQNYYKTHQKRQREEVNENHVVELVKQERAVRPRLGGRKLLYMLRGQLREEGIKLGRDKFFGLLRKNELLLERLSQTAPKTTGSQHTPAVYRNRVKDMRLSGPNQAWADGITCIRTAEGFLYLALLSDMRARKIAGYHAGDTLESEGAPQALRNAAAAGPAGSKAGVKPVHHSDRGCQYCCHAYIGGLKKHGLGISMTGERRCYENALAERVNGILKQEYALGGDFKSKAMARKAISGGRFGCLTGNARIWPWYTKRRIKPIRFKRRRTTVNLFQDLTFIWLPIDTKFPSETYERLNAAYDRGNAEEAE